VGARRSGDNAPNVTADAVLCAARGARCTAVAGARLFDADEGDELLQG